MSATPQKRIAICGAGIAGLAAAIGLADNGWRVTVFEREADLRAIGAGIQISPNAHYALEYLKLDGPVLADSFSPEAIQVFASQKNQPIAKIPLGDFAKNRYGHTYSVIHRGELQRILLEAAGQRDEIEILLGHKICSLTQSSDSVCVSFQAENKLKNAEFSLAIAADGIRSAVRRSLNLEPADFSGKIAWRAVVSSDAVQEAGWFSSTRLFLASGGHAVVYPINGGKQLNIIVIVPDPLPPEGAPTDLERHFPPLHRNRFHPSLMPFLQQPGIWSQWPLYALSQSGRMAIGRVALIGDAAHAMLPFAAQGGAMGLEDAAILVQELAKTDNYQQALERFAGLREPRVNKVMQLARTNGQIYHLPKPLSIFRNIAMSAAPAKRLLARQDWVFSWRPDHQL